MDESDRGAGSAVGSPRPEGRHFPRKLRTAAPLCPEAGLPPAALKQEWPGGRGSCGSEARTPWSGPHRRGRRLLAPGWSSVPCLLLAFPSGGLGSPGTPLVSRYLACALLCSSSYMRLYLIAPLHFSCFSRLPFSASPHPRPRSSEHMRLRSPGCGS